MALPIDRRRLLAGITAAMGCALSPGAARALDAAANFTASQKFKVLNGHQLAALRAVMDTIMPATETASASGAGVDTYVDHMMAAVLSPAEAKQVTNFLVALEARHPGFAKMDAKAQYGHLAAIDRDMDAKDTFHANYRAVKELILIGYYTSEIGASKELAYDRVPGPFHNGPVSEYSRTWATLGAWG